MGRPGSLRIDRWWETCGAAIQHAAVDRCSSSTFCRGFFLALLFFSLQNLAIGSADPDIRGGTLVAFTGDDHDVVENLFAIASQAAREDFAGNLTDSNLDR